MRPRFFPRLVNDRFGDPALFVNFLNERRAMLFDLGDISALPAREVLRLTDVFVSHTHIDHFIGFDHLLRLLVGRDKRLRLYGPEGFLDRVAAKLDAYTWNLAHRFETELEFDVTETRGEAEGRRARFRFRARFSREGEEAVGLPGGLLREEPSLRVRFAPLDHRTSSLAFALEEARHVNVWRNRLAEMGLAPGPWLAELKAAIHAGRPDDTPIRADGRTLPLGLLRARAVSETPGQKLAYVADAAPTEANARRVEALARGADLIFVEAPFEKAEAARAADRAHLTTAHAGSLARRAGAERLEPFHFSPRHAGREAELMAEVSAAFRGEPGAGADFLP